MTEYNRECQLLNLGFICTILEPNIPSNTFQPSNNFSNDRCRNWGDFDNLDYVVLLVLL